MRGVRTKNAVVTQFILLDEALRMLESLMVCVMTSVYVEAWTQTISHAVVRPPDRVAGTTRTEPN